MSFCANEFQLIIYVVITYCGGLGMGWFACKYINRMNDGKSNA